MFPAGAYKDESYKLMPQQSKLCGLTSQDFWGEYFWNLLLSVCKAMVDWFVFLYLSISLSTHYPHPRLRNTGGGVIRRPWWGDMHVETSQIVIWKAGLSSRRRVGLLVQGLWRLDANIPGVGRLSQALGCQFSEASERPEAWACSSFVSFLLLI